MRKKLLIAVLIVILFIPLVVSQVDHISIDLKENEFSRNRPVEFFIFVDKAIRFVSFGKRDQNSIAVQKYRFSPGIVYHNHNLLYATNNPEGGKVMAISPPQ